MRSLALPIAALSLALALLPPPILAKEPSPDDQLAEKIRALDPGRPRAERLQAVKWINSNRARKEAARAIPALERCIKKDGDVEVRVKAVEALSMVAYQIRPRTCPLSVLEALTDPHEDVRNIAMGGSGMFDRVAEGGVPLLLKLTEATDAGVRGHAVLMLAHAEGKNPKSLLVARRATKDRDEGVRHDAHSAVFQITGRLEDAVPYWLRTQETIWEVSPSRPEPALTTEKERARRNLHRLASFGRLYDLGEERTEEMARLLVRLLESKSADARRVTAAYIGNLGHFRVTYLENPIRYAFPKPVSKREVPPFKGEARLRALKVEDRLRKLADKDNDAAVREAARYALKQLATPTKPKKPPER
jgi:hypothetical protein